MPPTALSFSTTTRRKLWGVQKIEPPNGRNHRRERELKTKADTLKPERPGALRS